MSPPSPARPPLTLTAAEHGMNVLAEALHAEHRRMCAKLGISPWDYCAALANVSARILAGSADMPETKAMERIDALRDIARAAYREERHGVKPAGRA